MKHTFFGLGALVLGLTLLAGCEAATSSTPGTGADVSGAVLADNLKLVFQLPGEASTASRALTDGQKGFAAQTISDVFFNTGAQLLEITRQYIGTDYPAVGQVKAYQAVTFPFSSPGMEGISAISMKAGRILAERSGTTYTLYIRTELSFDKVNFYPFSLQVEYQGLSQTNSQATDTLVHYQLGDTRGKCHVNSLGEFTAYYPDAPKVRMTRGIGTLQVVNGGRAFDLVFSAGPNFSAFGDENRVVVCNESGGVDYFLNDTKTEASAVPAADKTWLDSNLPDHSTSWDTYGGVGSVWYSLFHPNADGSFPVDSELIVATKLP